MRRTMTFLGLCAALPLCAATLQVNAPATEATLENDQELTLSEQVSVREGETAVFSARLTMTLPSEAVNREEELEDNFALTADSDGQVLVYALGWDPVEGLTVAEGDTLDVRVAVSRRAAGVRYDVRLRKNDDASQVWNVGIDLEGEGEAGPDATFTAVALAGEGKATGLAAASVRTGILPPTEDGSQDAELVGKYVTWLNDSGKGGAMGDADDAALSDAFAMNVGGTPSLTVTAIDPGAGTLTVRGGYVPAAGGEEQPAPLNAINGTLYVTYSGTLGGEAATQEADVSLYDGQEATVKLPEGAVFIKARVSLAKPKNTLQ